MNAVRHSVSLCAFIFALALAAPARATQPGGGDGGTINIMRPEPAAPAAKHHRAHKPRSHREAEGPKGYGVKQDSRRGSSGAVLPAPLPAPQPPLAVPHQQVVTPQPVTPPPLYVPQTGRALPNLPNPAPSGPRGQETFQDRAARCAHQAGVYGQAAGNTSTYINSCINQ
jgi:hypothetical protein